jgi:hypothetical protein
MFCTFALALFVVSMPCPKWVVVVVVVVVVVLLLLFSFFFFLFPGMLLRYCLSYFEI